MKLLHPYLVYSGTCREALEFYAQCLDGEILSLQTFKESPMDVAEDQQDKIFNSVFRADNILFMASDSLPNYPFNVGNNFSLFVTFSDAEEMKSAFEKLAEDGQVIMALQGNFGMLLDKYNVQWMVSLRDEQA